MKEYITKEGLEKIKEKLRYLEGTKRKEIAEKLGQEIEAGDLSENAQYHELKRQQSFLEGKILELKEIVKKATIIDDRAGNDVVRVGSTVSVILDGEEEKFKIVGPTEIDPLDGKISYQSPLGKALLGKREKESFEFEGPGKKIKGKILKIE